MDSNWRPIASTLPPARLQGAAGCNMGCCVDGVDTDLDRGFNEEVVMGCIVGGICRRTVDDETEEETGFAVGDDRCGLAGGTR